MNTLNEKPAQDLDGDGIHYGQTVINFIGYWVAFLFTIIIVWILGLITYQMRFPPTDQASNYLSENVQLVGYVVSAFVGSITTLLAVFAGKKATEAAKATADIRKQDQKTMQDNRESVYKSHTDELGELKDEEKSNIFVKETE
jgi:uncharacterized membrane protein